MERYICIHGHFYQPPRENPWLEEVELQNLAAPYHDWNERITAQCYAPNTASRILDDKRRIIDIVNNFNKISFNFGPTLLSWMQRHSPQTYEAIILADKQSRERFSGHGSALAQVYNHIIMPLANERDKRTQVIWGIEDFKSRFGRKPEGMWLAETAADLETLDILAQHGIKFTILSPRQAKSARGPKDEEWRDVSRGFDIKRPYLCSLPSGRKISLFFYDGGISHQLAFAGLLNNGENFARTLAGTFDNDSEEPQLAHVATDGETYGHHYQFGEMGLSYALYYIEKHNLAKLANYGEYLSKFPARYEVRIHENSSWSCAHGVERWRNSCGCNAGHSGWQQDWRKPLRKAMDWLRDNLADTYEEKISQYFKDPWQARDDYIAVVLNRSTRSVNQFFARNLKRKEINYEDKIKILKLMESQRNAMLMYTSCGWFFDDISGIETTQIMQYAARAAQLAKEAGGVDLEPGYIKILKRAQSNFAHLENGAKIYGLYVKPSVVDLERVGAHYMCSSVFKKYEDKEDVYCYSIERKEFELTVQGSERLAFGQIKIHSTITWEETFVTFCALYLGKVNLIGGLKIDEKYKSFESFREEAKDRFQKMDIAGVIASMDNYLGSHNYSLWHLFRDEQRRVVNSIVETAEKNIEKDLDGFYGQNFYIIQSMKELDIPLSKTLSEIQGITINRQLYGLLKSENIDLARLEKLIDIIKLWSIEVDKNTLNFLAEKKILALMERLIENPRDGELLLGVKNLIDVFNKLDLSPNLWRAQNIYFKISGELKEPGAALGGKEWMGMFRQAGAALGILFL